MKDYCDKCQQETNHSIIHEQVESYRDDYVCDEHYQIIRCDGCDRISFRYQFDDIEAGYPADDEWYIPKTAENYPKALKGHRMIKELVYVPNIVKDTYIQSVSAYKEGDYILAGLGFRAVIEAICNDQNVTGRNLEVRINKLSDKGIVSKSNAKLLHAIRFLGNDAAHEIKNPTEEALSVTLDIIEYMIKSLYVLEEKAQNAMETVVETYDQFANIIRKNLVNYKVNDEIPLAQIIGKDIRRFAYDIKVLEKQLEGEIKNGDMRRLKLGKIDTYKGSTVKYQHYIVQK